MLKLIKMQTEERSAYQLQTLLNSTTLKEEGLKTVNEVRKIFGEKAEIFLKEITKIIEILQRIAKIFDRDNFVHKLPRELDRIDKVLQYLDQYESGILERRKWAEKMQARFFKHFFDEDFYDVNT